MYLTLFRLHEVDEALKSSIVTQNGTELQAAGADVGNAQTDRDSQEQLEPPTAYPAILPYKSYVSMFCICS